MVQNSHTASLARRVVCATRTRHWSRGGWVSKSDTKTKIRGVCYRVGVLKIYIKVSNIFISSCHRPRTVLSAFNALYDASLLHSLGVTRPSTRLSPNPAYGCGRGANGKAVACLLPRILGCSVSWLSSSVEQPRPKLRQLAYA